MTKPKSLPRRSRVTIPQRCHPLSKLVFAEMQRQRVTYDELEYRSGVLRSTFKAWRTNNRPGLDTIEAALGVLGYNVLPVPKAHVLPNELRQDLEKLALRHSLSTLPCLELMAVAAARPLDVRPGRPKEILG